MFFKKQQRFSIRKFTIGACSVLLGTAIVASVDQAKADQVVPASTEVSSTDEKAVAEVTTPAATTAESTVAETAPASEAASEATSTTASTESAAPKVEETSTANSTAASTAPATSTASSAVASAAPAVATSEVATTPAPAAVAPTTSATTAATSEAASEAATPEVSAPKDTLTAAKAQEVEAINAYSLLSEELKASYIARLNEATDAAALELISKEAKRAQKRAESFPKEGQPIPTGTGFRAETPNADEVLDTTGFTQLNRFSNKEGVFYVQKSGTVNGGQSDTDKVTTIYEIDTKTGNIVPVSKDDFVSGGTLYEHLEKLSTDQGFVDSAAGKRAGYKVINALGLSNDGRHAYALGITSNINVDDRTTINGIYSYDTETQKWSLASNSNDWADGMAVMKTNAWTAGAVNPKDGKYYFGTLTLKSDPAFSQVAPRDDAAYKAARDNGTFDLYFRMWSFDPATGKVENAGYIDTGLMKSGKFDTSETYFNAAGESYVVGNDIAFDTDGNFKLILNQFNTSNYFVYEENKAAFDAAASQNNKYAAHNGTLSNAIPIVTDVTTINTGGNSPEEIAAATAAAQKENAATTGGLAVDANGDLFFHSRQGKVGVIKEDLSYGGILKNVVAPVGTQTWGDAASIRGSVGMGNVYREYYITGDTEHPEKNGTILAGTIGTIVDGKFVPTLDTTDGTDDIEKDQALYHEYDATVGRPQAIRAADGTVYEYVGVKADSDPEKGEVKKDDQTVKYEYTPKAVTGNVVVTYVDVNGKELKAQVDDERNADVNTPYNTDVDRKLDVIRTADGKLYEIVPASDTDYKVGPVDANGHLKSSAPTTGTVEVGTKTVTYVYREVTNPTGDVILHYVDTKGNELLPNHHNSDDKPVGEKYTVTNPEKPEKIEKDGVVYKKVETSTTGKVGDKTIATENVTTSETGDIIEGTQNIVYVYKPVGSVVIHYVNTKGQVIKEEVKDITEGDIDTRYDAADNKESADEKPNTITKDGVTYNFKEVSTTNTVGGTTVVTTNPTNVVGGQTGNIVPGTTHVIYVYDEEVKPEEPVKKGSVVVNYIDTEGNPLGTQQDVAKDQPVGDRYDSTTEALKPKEIKVGDKTYVLAPADTYGDRVVDNNNHLVGSDAVVGDVTETTKTVTYVYKLKEEPQPEAPKGSVVVHYVNEAGEVIKSVYNDTTDGAVGTDFNAADDKLEKPDEITFGGKTYEFKEVSATPKVGDNTVVTTDAVNKVFFSPTSGGTVVEGTTHVVYVYSEKTPETVKPEEPTDPATPGGEVTAQYFVEGTATRLYEDPSVEKDTVVKEKDTPVDTPYGDTPPVVLTDKDGNLYDLVKNPDGTPKLKEGSSPQDGKVTEEAQVIQYEYKKRETPEEDPKPTPDPVGSVVVHYVNEEGVVIQSSYKDTTDGKVGSKYDTKETSLEKPKEITFDGKTYELVRVSDSNTVGGKEIVKTDDKNIVTAKESGDVVEGTTNVIYVYKLKEEVPPTPTPDPVKPGGEVSAQYFVEGTETRLYEDPAVQEDTVVKEKDTPVGTEYKDTPPAVLTDGTDIYDLVKNPDGTPKLKEGSSPQDGKVTEEAQVIQYEYKKRETPEEDPKPTPDPVGSVVVHYVNEEGVVIQSSYKDTTDGKVGSKYDTKETSLEKPKEITFDGKTYELVRVSDSNTVGGKEIVKTDDKNIVTAKESGDVVEGTTNVIYVYKLKEEVPPTPTPDPVKPGGEVSAQYFVEGTEDRLYEDPSVEKDTVVKEKDTPVDTPYGDTPPVVLTDKDGNLYDLVKNPDGTPKLKEGSSPQDGKVTEEAQVIQYEYKKRETPEEDPTPKPEAPKGSVVVKYEDEEGNEIKKPVEDTPNSPVDTPYNTIDKRDEKIEVPNPNDPENPTTVYYLSKEEPKEGSDPEDGKVKEGVSTVTYVYKKAGSVIVHYVDEAGNTLADDQVAKKDAKEGTEYDTTTTTLRPSTITTKDGKVYELVPAGDYKAGKVDEVGHLTTTDAVSGEVVSDKTKEITYVYKLKPETPPTEEPGKYIPYVPNDPENPDPKDPKPGIDIPTVPYDETPENPYDDPRLPNVPGYVPVDPNDPDGKEPLKPVDPNDPTKGYIPPTPTDPKETPVVYVKAGNVIVKYVNENGDEIKDEVYDERNQPEGKDYDTKVDNRPGKIVGKDGKVYELVPADKYPVGEVDKDGHLTTSDDVTGDVVGGEDKTVVYVYREVKEAPTTPPTEEPGKYIPYVPNDPENPDPKDPKPGIDIPTVPYDETPENPYDDPRLPNVPGYVPVDPNDPDGKEPLKPVDPNDPTKGYIPPTPTDPKETPVVYVKAGNVIVKYVNENGDEIKDEVYDERNQPEGKDYDTKVDNRPGKIVGKDGKVYELVPAGDYKAGKVDEDGHLTTSDDVTGDVVGGADKTVVYVYREVKEAPTTPPTEEPGKYIPYVPNDPENPDPKDPKPGIDIPTVPYDETPENPYDDPRLPNVPGYVPVDPNDPDGKEPLKPVDPNDPTKGYIPPTPTDPKETPVVYVKAGNVIVKYVNENGDEIKDEVYDERNQPEGKDYDTKVDNRPGKIVGKDGKVYELVPAGDYKAGKVDEDGHLTTSDDVTGDVVGGADKTVVYVYREVKEAPTTPPTEEPGKYIPYVPNDPENPDPKDPKPGIDIPTVPYDETPENPYDDPRLPNVPGYVPVDPNDPDGKEPLKPVDPNDPTKGYIPPTPTDPKETPVVYVKAGNVIVKYVNENGDEIKDEVYDERNQPEGKDYDTKVDNRPGKIVGKDGKVYELVPAGDYKAGKVDEDGHLTTSDDVTGDVVGGADKTVVYVYREVKEAPTTPPTEEPGKYIPFIPVDPSNPNDPTDPHDPIDPNTGKEIPTRPYDENPNDPSDDPRLPDVDGYVPLDPNDPNNTPLKPVDPNDPTKGYIPPTPTDPKETPVPYVPAGTVTVHYVNEDGDVIKDPTVDTPKSPVGTKYDTNENGEEIPKEITTEDGKVYELVKVKDGDKPTGEVEQGNTDVTYIYKLKPTTPPPTETPNKYIPYIPVDPSNPTDPKDPLKPTIPETGKDIPTVPYDETPEDPTNNPPLPDVDGYIPVDPQDPTSPLKPKDPNDPTKGYEPPKPVDPKKDTPVPYVPAGTVTVHYVNEKGEEIKDPTVDTPKSPIGTPYNTNENGKEIPKTITDKDGNVYELVKVKDGDSETGKVTKGNTNVTYIYKLKVTEDPKPNDDKPGNPTPDMPGQPGNPTPGMPGQPGNPAEPGKPAKETVPMYMKNGESLPNTGDAASQSGLVYGAAALGLTALLAAMKKKSENEE
ncbi:MucBP domain-containing protein [Streptococcus pneumoniae]